MTSRAFKVYSFIVITIELCDATLEGKSLQFKNYKECKNGFHKVNDTCIENEKTKICNSFIIIAKSEGITVSKLYKNFTNIKDSADIMIKTSLKNPKQIYYNLNDNYIIYGNDRAFHKIWVNFNNSNNFVSNIKNDYEFPNNILKPNSQLAIDWVHNLLYFISDKKIVMASDIENFDYRTVIANKTLDVIICLAVNPIESFIVWCDHDYQSGGTFLNKALQDGSNQTQILENSDIYIREIVIDHNSKRLFWSSTLELSSINFDGSDKLVISNSVVEIFDFDLLGDYIYWIEFGGTQLFRSSNEGFETYENSVEFNFTINKFELVDSSKQPKGTNQCLHSECSQLCLPVFDMSYRCVCVNRHNCTDNQIIRKRKESTAVTSKTISTLQTIPIRGSTSDSTTRITPKPTTIFAQKGTSSSHSIVKKSDSQSDKYTNDSNDHSFKLAVVVSFLSSILIVIIITL